jgi:hypothetical protein
LECKSLVNGVGLERVHSPLRGTKANHHHKTAVKLIAVAAVELGRIGVNLNQQILAMNTAVASGQDIPNLEESLAVVEKVYDAVRALLGELLFGDSQ